MERRRKGEADRAWSLFVYRHTKTAGYKVPCPNAHLVASCCRLCRDTGEIGFFRAERIKAGRKP